MQDIKKRVTQIFFAIVFSFGIVLFQRSVAHADGEFTVRLGTGVGALVGRQEKIIHGGFVEYFSVLQLGVLFDNKMGVSFEGQIGFVDSGEPGVVIGSLIGEYHFSIKNFPDIQPVIMLGIGYGWVLFGNETSGENEISGPLEFQVGGGIEYSFYKWFVLGGDARLRIGFPDNPDVVSLTFLLCVTFRL